MNETLTKKEICAVIDDQIDYLKENIQYGYVTEQQYKICKYFAKTLKNKFAEY